MKKIILKNTKLELSNICLGGGNFGNKLTKEAAFEVMDLFLSGGGNFIDTANVYCRWIPGLGNCSEQIIGEWLKTRKAKDKVIIATKGAHYDFSNPEKSRVTKKDIVFDLEDSLNTLGLNQIDLYWLHRDDKEKPIEEIIDIMEELVKEGKIRYYGASNFNKERLEAARIYARDNHLQGFSAVSNQWSAASVNKDKNMNSDSTMELIDRESYEWHKKYQVPFIPYTSTANGFFEKLYQANPKIQNGKLLSTPEELGMPENLVTTYVNERNVQLFEEFLAIKKETGASMFALSVAFLLNQPFAVIPIGSVSHKDQLNGLLEASDIILNKDIMEKFGIE